MEYSKIEPRSLFCIIPLKTPEIFSVAHGGWAHPVFPFVFKLFLKPVDLLLEHVDPFGELDGGQLLLLLVT